MTALPLVLAERLTALMRIGVALVPMLPLVLIRLTVGLVSVEFPDRVMLPLPPAVRFIVLVALELPKMKIAPLPPVTRVNVPPDDAPRLTEPLSVIKTLPEVFAVRFGALAKT